MTESELSLALVVLRDVLDEDEERLALFAGRMAQRVTALSQTMADQQGAIRGYP
jgi:hypothetical protein